MLSVSWLYSPDVPFQQSLAKTVLEHWSLGVFHTIQSGAPLSFTMGTDVALNGTGQQQHAQLVNGATYDDIVSRPADRNAMIQQFFNTAAFVNPNALPARRSMAAAAGTSSADRRPIARIFR